VAEVIVIGAGVVGTAIARELARHNHQVMVIDKNLDVGEGTSKANTAILHTGFDAKPGTLESKLVSKGYFLLKEHAKETGIAVEETGALLVAWTQEEFDSFPELIEKSHANGYQKIRQVNRDELYEMEPNLGSEALGALLIEDEFVIDPWNTTLSYALQAESLSARFILGEEVTGLTKVGSQFSVKLGSKNFEADWVVNVAGLYSDRIDGYLAIKDFKVTPRKGELIVFDKLSRNLISHIILPVPSKVGKGVLVSPTVFGNLMLGPTAQDQEDKEDKENTYAGFEFLKSKVVRILPSLVNEEVTATYAGLRAATENSDYQIRRHDNYLTVGGIRSTGLTASLAIAEYLFELAPELKANPRALPAIKMPPLGEKQKRPFQDEVKISTNSEYGKVICFCEKVTYGEVDDVLNSPLPPKSLSALARRTRAGLGRCQGFYCYQSLIERTGIKDA
jgi:glycerol-3-phosphate dehydrogenase